MDDEYEQETKIYADKDKFVTHTYFNGKKGESRRTQLISNNKTGEVTYKDSNPLIEMAANMLIGHNKKKERKNLIIIR